MGAKSNTLKLDKDSPMGALHLVSTGPGRLPKDHPFAPCKLYLDSLARGGVRAQRVNLERAVRLLLGVRRACVGDYDWRGLRFDEVERVRSRLRFDGYSVAVIRGTLSALKRVARYAWKLEQMTERDYLLIQEVEGVKGNHRVRAGRALSAEEIASLFHEVERAGATVAGARDAALLALLYAGGLRAAEASRLELKDYSRREHSLRVHGKGDRDRTIYFHDGGARRALHAWLRLLKAEEGFLLRPVNRHGEILPRQLSYPAVYAALIRRARRAGLKDVTPHNLRRSIATHIEEETGDIELVRDFLGHADVRTTGCYIRRGDRARKRAADQVSVPYRMPTGGRARRKKRRRSSWRQALRSKLNSL